MSNEVKYLRSLPSIRQRCSQIFELGKKGELDNWQLNLEKLPEVVDFVMKVTRESYPDSVSDPATIPFHSRFRHFEAGNIIRQQQLLTQWQASGVALEECARRLLDLVVVSVLVDAGAGPSWKYVERESGQTFARSEGLGVASVAMFCSGLFSSDPAQPHRVDSAALKNLTNEAVAEQFQVSDSNPMVGLEGRTELLRRLGRAIEEQPEYFPAVDGLVRPGSMLTWLNARAVEGKITIDQLWELVIYGLEKVWPASRTSLDGVALGDVWPHPKLAQLNAGVHGGELVTFHKLSQWLTYSLMEPLVTAGITVADIGPMTGLPEYRNGGLLMDLGLVTLKDPSNAGPFHPHDTVIVEWRALTICLLDLIAEQIRSKLNMDPARLPLVKILEGGTWKAGRVAAKERRADGSPPINIISDGTVF